MEGYPISGAPSQWSDEWSTYSITLQDHVFESDFHPVRPVVASASVSGRIIFHSVDFRGFTEPQRVAKLTTHAESCRSVKFFPQGDRIVSGSADSRVNVTDVNGHAVWKGAHTTSVNKVYILNENCFVSGDDSGEVRIWDIREGGSSSQNDGPRAKVNRKAAMKFKESEEYVSDFASADRLRLFTTCGDRLIDFDLRKNKVKGVSHQQESDLTCLVLLGNQVLCGTHEGQILVFALKDISHPVERLAGHPEELECITVLPNELWQVPLKDHSDLAETTSTTRDAVMITGCGTDNLVRVVGVGAASMRILGVAGEHQSGGAVVQSNGDLPESVDNLSVSATHGAIASCGNDNAVRFHSLEAALNIVQLQRRFAAAQSDALPTSARLVGEGTDSDQYGRKLQKGTFFDEI